MPDAAAKEFEEHKSRLIGSLKDLPRKPAKRATQPSATKKRNGKKAA